jgi:hypothetical protein
MPKDPNFEAQVAAAKTAASAFLANPSAAAAKELRVKIDSVVWTN